MSVKSTKQEKQVKEDSNFPCLFQSVTNDYVVLFVSENSGVVVTLNDTWPIGHYSEKWWLCTDETVWKRYEGTITLENE